MARSSNYPITRLLNYPITRVRWALALAIVLSLAFVNPYVRGDGNGYYAWLVSPAIDHDLDFRNQYAHGEPLFRSRYFDQAGQPLPALLTRTGRLENQWSVGPALLWAPWFLTAHVGVRIARWWGSDLPADGYAWPYRWACAIGTVVYGWIGLLLARRAALLLGVSDRAASIAMIAAWAASPLPVYQYFLPFHVHALAAFAVALFLWWWLAHRPLATPVAWGVWGLSAGLMTVVYHFNVVVLLVVPFAARDAGRKGAASWTCAAAFAGGAAAPWLPQLVGKAIVYGSPFTTGYQDRFFWTAPHLWDTAWSPAHGLFLWTPLAIAGLAGLCWLARRRREAAVLLATSVAFYYAVASFENWHGVSSFGNRFFVSLTALLVAGVGALVHELSARRRWGRGAAIAGLALLSLWNAGLAFQWGTKLMPNRGPVDVRAVARQQVTVVPREIGRFVRQYFTDRAALTGAIERQDATEWHAQREGR
jgi:hypothetical protein